MASESWIESASRGEPATRGGDGFVDTQAAHLLHGAFAAAPGEVLLLAFLLWLTVHLTLGIWPSS